MKTEKKNNSAMRKLIPATSMLLVSAMMLASSTYAWFTMNKEVTVTGMEVHTKVGSNLLIAEDTLSHAGDNVDSLYKTDIKQIRKCLLEPSSTVDGINYFYTVEAAADGKKLSGAEWKSYSEGSGTDFVNTTAGKTKYDATFNTKYTINGQGSSGAFTPADATNASGPAYGYVDYTFYIKATSDTNSQHVALTKCNLLYNGAALSGTTGSGTIPNIDKAWRVALFAESTSANTEVENPTSSTSLISILKPANAVNHDTNKAVNSATATSDITNHDSAANFSVIATAGTTAYYKVTVRLWLEGEDTTCTSETYAKLTSNYTLDLKFELQNSGSDGVNSISSDPSWHGKLYTSGS